MLILTGTTDKLQLTRSSAADIDVHCSYVDHTTSTDNVEAGRQNSAFNTAATGDIVAVPGSGVIRNVKNINIRNKHASLSCDVTVLYDLSSTDTELIKITLAAGQTLAYVEGVGWFIYVNTSKMFKNLRVASDVTNATTSFADITGLTATVEAGKFYNFESHIYHIENANTTGARFGINGPAMTALRLSAIAMYTGSLTAAVMHGPTADVAALDTSVLGVTTASTTTPQVVLAIISGYINPSASGTFAMRSQSEVAVAAGVTIKAGSWLQIWETDN